MRKVILLLGAALFLVNGAVNSYAAELKVGVADVVRVFDSYDKTKDFNKSFEVKMAKEQDKLKAKKKELETIKSRLSLLKEEEREKEQDKFFKAQMEYGQLERKAVSGLKKERQEKVKEIIADIDKAVKEYAEKKKYDLIINGSAVIYAGKSVNITQEVLNMVNNRYKKEKK